MAMTPEELELYARETMDIAAAGDTAIDHLVTAIGNCVEYEEMLRLKIKYLTALVLAHLTLFLIYLLIQM